MGSKTVKCLFPVLLLFTGIHPASLGAEPFEGLSAEVLKILRVKFTDADLARDKNLPFMNLFTHGMREFVIYRLNKVGEWQKPVNVQGPDRGGLSVRFYVKQGKWEGALEVPYCNTHDLHVFKETLIIRNSADGNWHLWVEVLTPKADSPDEVANKLVDLFKDFEKYR